MDYITNPGYSIGKGSEKLLSSLRTVFNPDRDQFYFTNCVIIFQQHFPRKEHTFCVLTACTDFSLNRWNLAKIFASLHTSHRNILEFALIFPCFIIQQRNTYFLYSISLHMFQLLLLKLDKMFDVFLKCNQYNCNLTHLFKSVCIFEFVWIWFSAIVFTQIFQRHILKLWNWIKCLHTWYKYSSHIKKMFDNISWVIDSWIHLQWGRKVLPMSLPLVSLQAIKGMPGSISDFTTVFYSEVMFLYWPKIPVYFSWKRSIRIIWTHSTILLVKILFFNRN